MWLFALLIAVPIIEIALFIEVGGAIGLWPTLAIVILTAAAGAALLRLQGRGALIDLRRSIAGGGDPAKALAHGALVLVAGVLLLTPGFFTDALGFALLVPGVRSAVIAWGARRFAAGDMTAHVHVSSFEAAARGRPRAEDGVIDGEFQEIDPRDPSAQDPDETATGRIDGPNGKDPAGRPSGWTRPR